MRGRIGELAAALAALVLASAGCITDRILVEGDDGKLHADPAQFRRVERETARMRHLPFQREVPADIFTVAELRAWFDQYADARKEQLAKEDRFFHRTNILPPTVSTADAYKGFLADFVGGVYDDGTGRMILVSDYAWWSKLQQDLAGMITGVDWAYEIFLAHELVHALQDQHFDLAEMLNGSDANNDDAAFVRKTLLESEAAVVGMSHFLGMDLEQLATRKAFFLFLRYNNLLNGPLMAALSGRTPSYFAKQSFAQYELGLAFVERKLDEGGMDALSRAYVRAPGASHAGGGGGVPESTEQLLWPRKMRPETLDRPVTLAPLAVPPASLPGATLVTTNVFGALAFKHWLERLRGPLEASAVADGWGGDRWTMLDDAGNGVLVWRTTWDSPADATEMRTVYADAVRVRYGERAERAQDGERTVFVIPPAPDEERHVRTAREERVLVEQRGKDVLIVEGATPEQLDAVAAELWLTLVPSPPPAFDAQRFAEKAARLEESIGEAPPPHERPDLLGRLFLPARTMAVRLGTGIGVEPDAPAGLDPVFLVNDLEMRWGFRPGLELALPLALSAEARTTIGQTVVGARLDSLWDPRVSFHVGHALGLGNDLAVVGQLGVDGVGVTLPDPTLRLAGGALMRPAPHVVLAPGIARADDETVVMGSALRRGFGPVPLVELEVVDGLFIYESTVLLFDQKPRGLALRAHTHVLGLLFYF